jgi:hypothetical protein
MILTGERKHSDRFQVRDLGKIRSSDRCEVRDQHGFHLISSSGTAVNYYNPMHNGTDTWLNVRS